MQLDEQSGEFCNVPDSDTEILARLEEIRRQDREFAVARIAAVIAHAVGTPLNIIVGRAGLIRSSPDVTESIVKEVECIERKVEQLAQRLRGVVDFCASTQLATSSCRLVDAISEAASLYGPLARGKGVTLQVGEAAMPEATVDRTLASVVLTNLLSLALDDAARHTTIELEAGYCKADQPLHVDCLWFGLRFSGGKLPVPKPLERLEFPPSCEPRLAHQHQVLMLSSSMLRSAGGRLEVSTDSADSTLLTAYLPICQRSV